MSTTNELSSTSTITGGDLLPLWVTAQGSNRKVSITDLLSYIAANVSTGIQEYTIQRAAPSATGFSISITDTSNNYWLIITPSAGYAAGTIVLPASTNAKDKQEILINCTQQVTALTIDGNGAVAVTGAPASLGADDFFKLKYDLTTQTWYRVG